MVKDTIDYKAMAFMHDVPRFWHTRNIAVLASQEAARKNDYVQGIIAFSIFLLSFFLLWALALAFFKWRGIKKYGCIAGQVIYKKNDEDKNKAFNRFQVIQYIFITCIIGLIIGCTMLLNRGVPFLAKAVGEIRVLNSDLRNTLSEGQSGAALTAQGIQAVKGPLEEIRSYTNLDDYCSNADANAFRIGTSIDGIVDNMDGVQDFLDRYELEGLESNINIMMDRSNMLEDALDTYSDHDWIAKMYVLSVGSLCVFLFCYTVSSWCYNPWAGANLMAAYFVMPAFTLAVLGGWFIMIAFAVGSTMNSGEYVCMHNTVRRTCTPHVEWTCDLQGTSLF